MWFLIPSVSTGSEERRSKEAEPLPTRIEAQVYVPASCFIVGLAGPLYVRQCLGKSGCRPKDGQGPRQHLRASTRVPA